MGSPVRAQLEHAVVYLDNGPAGQALVLEELVYGCGIVATRDEVGNFIGLGTNFSELRGETPGAHNIQIFPQEFLQLRIFRFLVFESLDDSLVVAEHVDNLAAPALSPEPG